MCGRFTLGVPEGIAARFDAVLDGAEGIVPRYNIAPTQRTPVVVAEADGRQVCGMRWGFRPAWARPSGGGAAPINARAETLRERPLFRGALARGRCLIPADGFYEWRVEPGQRAKQPYYIRRADGGLFAFAGLYTAGDGEDGATYAIITTAPNGMMGPIHDRMPAILRPEDEPLWLDRDRDDPAPALRLLRPYPDDLLVAYPVAARVSAPRADGPALIEPLSA